MNNLIFISDAPTKRDARTNKPRKRVIVQCLCGKQFEMNRETWNGGKVKSCGCSRGKSNTRHGMTNSRIHHTWLAMKGRCDNKNHHHYKYYGGRGIKVCPEWYVFENFYNDTKEGYSDTLTIERIDVNKGYEKGNITWIPHKDQALNKRTTIRIEYNGQTMRLTEACQLTGVAYPTALYRYSKKWKTEEITLNKRFPSKRQA